MNDSIKKISLDLHAMSSRETVKVKRNDTGRKIYVSLVDGGMPYRIGEDCYAVFTGKKPDGKVMFNDCTIEGNVICYTLTEQTSAVPGLVACEITLHGADGKQITSSKFSIMVENTVYNEDDAIESTPEFSALATLVAETQALKEEIPATIESALTEAKNSGEFDGVSVTHEWDGTVLKVTSASGESSADLKGEKGEKGEKGDPGADGADGVSPKLTIGTVETLEEGSAATATITGTDENPVLNLGIPKGESGEEIFIAEYGVTSRKDILQAVDEGKTCFCKNGAYTLPMTRGENQPTGVVFSGVIKDRIVAWSYLQNRGWSETSYAITNEMPEDGLSGYLPTAQAVQDFVMAQLEAMPNAAEVGY